MFPDEGLVDDDLAGKGWAASGRRRRLILFRLALKVALSCLNADRCQVQFLERSDSVCGKQTLSLSTSDVVELVVHDGEFNGTREILLYDLAVLGFEVPLYGFPRTLVVQVFRVQEH
jgi:hypothetical protein